MHFDVKSKAAVTSLVFAVGMTGFGVAAQTTNPPQSSQQQTTTNSQNNTYSQEMVRQAQEQLKKDGYYTGNVDGHFGHETRAAIQKYQQSQNLKVNGRLDKETIQKLGISNK